MHSRLLIPAILLLVAACSGPERAATDTMADSLAERAAATDGVTTITPADSGCAPGLLADSAAGPIRLGMSVEEARARCPAAHDTTALGAEGMRERILHVPVGADTVAASIVEGRVWRLAVTTRGLRTRDSLGVGTPLARLLALPGARGITGEGRTFVIAEAPCGLSFELSNGARGAATDTAALRRLPRGTIVRRVLVTGCGE